VSNDWIDRFVESTDGITSPMIFRKWAGISTIAAALERKVWVRTKRSPLYPNLYVVLVAPPGIGKTEVTWRVREMLASLEELHLAPTSVTKASLIDDLAEANRRVVHPEQMPPVTHFNSIALCINELGVLIPSYENEFMNTLTDLYDCKHYSEKRRTKKIDIKIEAPQINLLGACTPAYLMDTLPEGAWNQGFLSRTILIYTGEQELRSLFEELEENKELDESLKTDLTSIHELFGKMTFTPEAAQFIDNWNLAGGPPAPDHPKLLHYNTRRTAHVLKLSMIAAVSAHGSMTIQKEDIERAMDWLIEAEMFMPDIFKAMSSGGAGKNIEEAWYYLFTTYSKEKEPIAEHRLIQFLQERIPVHSIAQTIDMMERSKLIEKRLLKSGNCYIPKGKKPNT